MLTMTLETEDLMHEWISQLTALLKAKFSHRELVSKEEACVVFLLVLLSSIRGNHTFVSS